jgi:ketosteroid isomerase-like protein
MVDSIRAAPPYQLKWGANIGVATHIGAQSAKLVPGGNEQDIVLTGVTQVDSGLTNGSVVCLNGTTGAQLWKTTPGNILDHAPFEIADLNNDGKQEIVVAEMPSTLALYGVNGSIYWKNDFVPSYDVSPVTADVDGDGHKEVFVASGRGPYEGVDYISELSYTGQLIAQSNTSWHPCYGGLAIVDPKNDGHFILLMGDRSLNYNPSEDPYKYGGWGVRALDARTLTPLWNDSSILCSSQIPELADVDGDGVLDVVVSAQSRGLAVYNITSGQVLDTGGIYRKSQNLNLTSHSQPTIYIDQNGIPQFITCSEAYPKIWNLRDWSLTATINLTAGEPPKMGRVTADGQMDIIVVAGNDVHIFNENFQEVGNIMGLNQPNEMTLVSDIDGDGYNELVLTTRSGWIYCYSTPASATTPTPRSNVGYYSEYRNGVAQYVEPPGPSVPRTTALSPSNGATNVPINISSLSFKLLDYWGYPLNYTVTTLPNIGTGAGTNVYNGVYNVSISGLQYSTTYSWQVTATDGAHPNVTTFTFTTVGSLNAAPVISAPSPANGSSGVPITLSNLFFTLIDGQNDRMNYTVTTSPNVGSGSGTNVTNGMYNVSISALQYSTTYTWLVNATDGLLNNLATFTFTTAAPPPPNTPPQVTAPIPTNGSLGVSVTLSNLFFSLNDADNDLMNYTVVTAPNIGTGNRVNVANGIYNVSISGLQYSTGYSWQINVTDGKNNTLVTFTFTTATAPPANNPPQITAPSPSNGSTGVSVTLSNLFFTLTDADNDLMNYTVIMSPNVGGGNGFNVTNGMYNVSVSGLQYSTAYLWQVTVTDGKNSTVVTFTFTTAPPPPPNNPPQVTSPVPSNGATGVPLTQSYLFFNLSDADNDLMNYTVVTNPNIGSGGGTRVLNGLYNVSIGGLQYSTTYQWQVNVTDGKNNTVVTFTFTTGGPPPSQQQWWDAAWQYRMNVTIDHTKVTASLANFPVLVDLTTSSLATHAQLSGNDIIFIDSLGNKLNHEIESYNSASGHLVAWVLIPNLSSTTNTVLSLYYGNPSSPNQQNPNSVWDSNFLLVQHLNTSSSTQRDSTSNHNDGTTTGAVTTGTPGKIAGSISFTGGNMTLPTVLSSQTQFTFSAWIYAQSGARYFISKWANNQGAFLQVVGDNYVQFYVNSMMVQKPVTLNQWHYVVGTFNGSVMNLWVDGGSASSVSASSLTWPSQNTYVGDRYDHTRQFIGLIDEVRVSSIARSNDWINTEYINQNATSTFYTVGIEEVQTSNPPIVSNPSPNEATGVNLNPTLSVQINTTQGQPMTIYFLSNTTGIWQTLGSYANLPNGTVTQTTATMNSYATTYYWRVEVTDGTNWTNKTFQFTTKLAPPSNWYDPSWQYRMNITISHTQVNSTFTNYPLLVDLTSSSLIGNTQVNGQDFVFTDVTNQKLDHQIEFYNSTTGHLTAWVRLPLLSSTTDTTIFMYYGNTLAPDQQNSTGIWDINYLVVLHLNDGPTQCNDSTIKGNNGTLSGNVAQTQGKIGNGYSFTGGNVSLPKILSSQTQFTFSAWIYAQSGARYFISEWSNNQGAFLQVVGDNYVQFYVNSMMVQKPVTLNQWHYVVGTYNGTTLSLWVDGGSPTSVTASALVWPNQNMYLGDRSDNQRTFYGLIDEVRVSNIARSNDWINTEYFNQNNPSAFCILGPQESFSP